MKKTIAIIVDFISISEGDLIKGCGGSETWAIEIAKQFGSHGYNVIVFTPNPNIEFASNNVQYMPVNLMDLVLSYTDVSYFFISRYFKESTLNIVAKYSLNKNLYIVAHDIIIMMNGQIITQDTINNNEILRNNLQKIIVMSNFGKDILQYYTGIEDKYFEVIGNGIAFDESQLDFNKERDNNLFWSSRHERGLDLLVNNILPHIKKKYPDIKVYVAQYENNLPDEIKNNESVVFLGRLGKKELYNEMLKHKVFFYPNTFTETFCITILEAILCENELITVNRHGPATTMQLFDCLLMDPNVDFSDKKIQKQAAEMIIDSIKNYDNPNRQKIRKILKNYISSEYSWESIFNKYKNNIFV